MAHVSPVKVKECKKCGGEFPATTQYFTKSDGYLCSPCNSCRNADRRRRVSENPEKYRKSYRKQSVKRTYGLSNEEFERLVENCKNCCMICGRHSSEQEKELHVDHCHKTGKVRGLLCSRCNTGIGMLGDNADSVKRALEYLESFEEKE